MTFAYELGQIVYYYKGNTIHSAQILSRMIVENLHNDCIYTNVERNAFAQFGEACEFYSTVQGIFPKTALFLHKDPFNF